MLLNHNYQIPNGTCIRNYVHINDLASAHLLAVAAITPTTAENYNVGTGNSHSVMQIHAACETVTGMEITFEVIARRPSDVRALVADSTKLKTRLDWQSKYTAIKAIVETAWHWHRQYPMGYASNRPD